MTREEEIKAKSKEFLPDILDDEYSYRAEFVFGFQEGAKWADKTIIKKACDWLKENTNPVFYNGNGWTTEEFIDNFKKAMKLCI